MLSGIDEADRLGASARPDSHFGAASLNETQRAAQTELLLRRASHLGDMDVGGARRNHLGDEITTSGTPPRRVWNYGPSDAAVAIMSFDEMDRQVQLELAEVERQLGDASLDAARRTALESAKRELQLLRTNIRNHVRAFHEPNTPAAQRRPPHPTRAQPPRGRTYTLDDDG